MFNHIADANFSFIQVINQSDKPVTVPRKTRLGVLSDYEDCRAYMFDSDATLDFAQTNMSPRTLPRLRKCDDKSKETKLPNGISVYGDPETTERLRKVIERHDVWTDHGGYVDIPEDHG
jgi:hypothetical protein